MANPSYNRIATGEVAGSATAKQLPNIECRAVCFIAVGSNAGNVYLGGAGVTKVDGTGDATTGYELDAGVQSPWFDVTNVNLFYIICDNAGDDLIYLAMG